MTTRPLLVGMMLLAVLAVPIPAASAQVPGGETGADQAEGCLTCELVRDGDDFRYIGAGPEGTSICGGVPQDCEYPGQLPAPDPVYAPTEPLPAGSAGTATGGAPAPPPPVRCLVVPAQLPVPSFDLAPLPAPTLETNPDSPDPGGVTGLEQWAWDATPTTPVSWRQAGRGGITADCVRTPPPVRTFTAAPVAWYWSFGDAGGDQRTAGPGSAEDPAGRWTYETKGYYQLTVVVEWAGDPSGTIGVRSGRELRIDEIVPHAIG